MMSEVLQERATLYALGLLDADEAKAFEHEITTDSTLRTLVRELQDTAAALALAAQEPHLSPSPELRDRIFNRVAEVLPESNAAGETPEPSAVPVAAGKIVRSRFGWAPWAIAAALLGCTVLLMVDRGEMRRQIDAMRRFVATPRPQPPDALSRVAFCELEPTPDAPVKPRAAVLWDAAQRKGVLKVARLSLPADGKDYQLWAVEAARKDPVNAGVVHLDGDGHADVTFEPEAVPGDNQVVALAISLERAGGSPTKQGPILFVGKF